VNHATELQFLTSNYMLLLFMNFERSALCRPHLFSSCLLSDSSGSSLFCEICLQMITAKEDVCDIVCRRISTKQL